MKRVCSLLITTIPLTSCATSSPTPAPTLPPTVEAPNPLPEPGDPTQLITVKAGGTLELVLPSNPSTGYHWDVIPEPDGNIVPFVERNYISEQPVVPGSGGMDVWTFRAVSAGIHRLC